MNNFTDVEPQYTEFISHIPGNLFKRISALLKSANEKDDAGLHELRKEFEKFLYHLRVLANIPDREWKDHKSVKNKIEFLAGDKIGLLKEGVGHYLNLWYGIGCIGSHHNSIADEKYISLKHHANMCIQAMLTVYDWYIQKYPPLSQKEAFREKSKKTLEKFKPIDLDTFVNPSNKKIEKTLKQNDLVVIHGSSWIGKTSLSCFALSKLVNEGFLPIIFHETNLISPSLLFENQSGSSSSHIQRLSLKDKAGALHKEIVTSIFRGDSCAILFDDPFGHRSFKPHLSPLSYLRISDWIKLSQEHTSLGSLKIILNTPTQFWDEVKKKVQNLDENTSPILKENLDWILKLNNKVAIESLSLKDYQPKEVALVVQNAGLTFDCKWSQDIEICSLLAESIAQSCNSFDTLRLFCLDTKDSLEENKLLDSAEKYFERSQELNYKVSNLKEDLQTFLVTVYIGEAFQQLSKDYLYSKSSFYDLCRYLKVEDVLLRFDSDEELLRELDYWISFQLTDDGKFASFPRFRHPDIRASLEIFVREGQGKTIASNLLINSDFVNCFCQETRLIMRWESIYVLCYFAYLLDQTTCQHINDNWFNLPKNQFDVDQTLWAISDNWLHIKDSLLEPFSIGLLKRIQNDFYASRRNLIWEVINNWSYMPEEIRMLILSLNSDSKSKAFKAAKIVEHHFISFMAAVFCNYRTLKSYSRRYSSESTNLCLDFANDFVKELCKEKNLNSPQYKSYEGDRVFVDKSYYSGEQVLLTVKKMGLDCGGLTGNDQIVKNIDKALRERLK